MAETWHFCTASVSGGFANNGLALSGRKSLVDIFNRTGTNKIIRVYRIFAFPNSAGTINQLNLFELRRTSDAQGGFSHLIPIARDTNNAALNAQTTCGFSRTVTGTNVFRRFIKATAGPVVSNGRINEFECVVPFAEIWNTGYQDANVQPITCRAGQGVDIFSMHSVAGAPANGMDIEFEFTSMSS
jgi:hypothetical protein